MAVYGLVELEVTDMSGMQPYAAAVANTVAAHGGKYLVSASPGEIIEGGSGQYPLKVILEFPSIAAARSWYGSDEYQAILPKRLKASNANFIWLQGV